MLLQSCALGVTMSGDEGLLGARASRPHNDGCLGARASRPHQAWHSLGHLPHLDQPGTAPWRSFDLADAVPADRVAGCRIAGKLSGTQRDSMRAGRPRSRVAPPPITLAPQGGMRRLAGPQPVPMRQSCHAWWPFVVLRGPSWITLFSFFLLFQISRAPALPGRSSEGETGLFQTSWAPALVCGSYKSETIRNRSSLRDLGIPSRLTSTP